MPHNVAFNLGLHCLPKYTFKGHFYIKAQMYLKSENCCKPGQRAQSSSFSLLLICLFSFFKLHLLLTNLN